MPTITAITVQARNPDRVNVSVDGVYRLSLDIFQLSELGIKVGKDYSEVELVDLETESQFGKLYARALEYTMLRPHSRREIRDYLWRKTRPRKATKVASRGGRREVVEVAGVSEQIADRVFARLDEKGYLDDAKFTRFWVENRNQRKGTSLRKLRAELQAKGIQTSLIDTIVSETARNDGDELAKIIAKKRARYPDEQKFMQFLARQGFSYDDIKTALQNDQ